MGYLIKCSSCQQDTWAPNIVDLINDYLEKESIFQESILQEEGETWQRYIKAVVPIKTAYETYTPYIFLTAPTEDADIDGIHFNYFKDTRKDGGSLRHGHGPGGSPVFSKDELLQLLEKLVNYGCFSKQDMKDFAEKLVCSSSSATTQLRSAGENAPKKED